MEHINPERATRFIHRKQHLTSDTGCDDLVQITKDVGGLHATGSTTPYLSLYARYPQFKRDDLDQALYEKRILGKIRCVRKTIYIHTKSMIPVVWKATASKVIQESKRFMQFRGVSDELYEEVSRKILQLLSKREMTASEIKAVLNLEVDVSSILYFMCDQGVLIRGRPEKGWRDKNHKYGLFKEYFPDIDLEAFHEEEAILRLVEQYLASFGPVTETDIVWWTGLGKTKVRNALGRLQDQLVEATIHGIDGSFVMLRSDAMPLKNLEPSPQPIVNLLPTLDPYLMGYKERRRFLSDAYYDLVFDRTGNATSVVLVNGEVVGVWDFEGGKQPFIKLYFFSKVDKELRDEIDAKAQTLGWFIADRKVQIKDCQTMVPLVKRTAGSVMSPLKGC